MRTAGGLAGVPLPTALVRVTVTSMKQNGPKQLGREGVIWLVLPYNSPSLKGVRAGTWRRKLIQGPCRDVAYSLRSLAFL